MNSQYELIKLLATDTHTKIVQEVLKSDIFSVLADTTLFV